VFGTLGLLAVLAASGASAPPLVVFPPEPPVDRGEWGWVSPVVAELLPGLLARAGVPAVDPADRTSAQEALEVPATPFSRATALRVAESLDAGGLVVGGYSFDGGRLTLSLHVLDAGRAALGPPHVATLDPGELGTGLGRLAWDIAAELGAAAEGRRGAFLADGPALPLEALRELGRALTARPAGQAKRLSALLLRWPELHAARLALGRRQLLSRDAEAARLTLSRVPAGEPESRAARFLEGLALLELGRYSDSARAFAALQAERTTAAVLNNRALAAARGGAYGPAASDLLRQAVALDPASDDLRFNLAWVLLLEGRPAAAEPLLRELVRRSPLDARARVVLTWLLRRSGREAEADSEWRALLVLAPGYEALASPDFSRRFEQPSPGERPMPPAGELRDPAATVAVLLSQAEALLAAGDREGAVRELRRAVYVEPHAPRPHVLLARAHLARGEREKAEGELRMALWSREDPDVRVELAELLLSMGRAAEARAEAKKALASAPDHAGARRILGGRAPAGGGGRPL
jgi:Flp pilus assembly protein TadD